MAEVLLVRAGALGDVLLLRRAVAALGRAGHSVCLLAPRTAGRALLGEGAGTVHELLDWEGPLTARLLAGEASSGPLGAALERADLVVCYTRSADLLAVLARRAGRVLAQDPSPPDGAGHASLWLARPVRELDADPAPEPPVLVPGPRDLEEAQPFLDALPPTFLAVHPGSGSPAKNWPSDRFAALVRERGGASWLLVDGHADARAAEPLRGLPGVVRAHALPVRTLLAILGCAGLYVGNDSGVSHLAAASGAPTLALFGPTDPRTWAPVGPRVCALRARDGSMQSLSAAEVRAAAEALTASAPLAPR